jgi:membrane associated rhomboid family serine protease
LGLIAIAAGLMVTPHATREALHWTRDAFFPWQWVSAHLLHLSWPHLAVNAAVAIGLAMVADRCDAVRGYGLCALWVLLTLNLGLHVGPWPMDWYAGASGLLHGQFAWLCLHLAREATTPAQRIIALLLLAGGGIKVAMSLATPVGSVGWLDLPQAPPAHAYGYLGGLLAGWRRRK